MITSELQADAQETCSKGIKKLPLMLQNNAFNHEIVKYLK